MGAEHVADAPAPARHEHDRSIGREAERLASFGRGPGGAGTRAARSRGRSGSRCPRLPAAHLGYRFGMGHEMDVDTGTGPVVERREVGDRRTDGNAKSSSAPEPAEDLGHVRVGGDDDVGTGSCDQPEQPGCALTGQQGLRPRRVGGQSAASQKPMSQSTWKRKNTSVATSALMVFTSPPTACRASSVSTWTPGRSASSCAASVAAGRSCPAPTLAVRMRTRGAPRVSLNCAGPRACGLGLPLCTAHARGVRAEDDVPPRRADAVAAVLVLEVMSHVELVEEPRRAGFSADGGGERSAACRRPGSRCRNRRRQHNRAAARVRARTPRESRRRAAPIRLAAAPGARGHSDGHGGHRGSSSAGARRGHAAARSGTPCGEVQYSQSVQNAQPARNARAAAVGEVVSSATAPSTRIVGTKMSGGTAGWTRVSRSRLPERKIGGDAWSNSVRDAETSRFEGCLITLRL